MAKEQNFAHPPRGHVAILAYDDVNNRWQVVECTADGYLKIRLMDQASTLLVQQVMPSLLQPGMNTYIGTDWQKQGMIWSFYDTYLVEQPDISDVAATFTVNLPEVDTGEVWVVNSVSVLRDTNVNQFARLQVAAGVLATSIEDIAIPTLGGFFPGIASFVMKAGQNVRVAYTGATVGENMATVAQGYKMKIDM